MRPINIFRTMAVAGAVLLAPSMLSAQVAHKPLSFALFGGASMPMGDASDAFNTGYTFGGSMDLRNSSMLGLRADASYSSNSFKATGVDGSNKTMGADLNAVLWTSKRPGASPAKSEITARRNSSASLGCIKTSTNSGV